LADSAVKNQVIHVAKEEKVNLTDDAAEALTRISQGDLRKAITALQVAAALDNDITRELIYETSATAPPEALHQYLMACRDDGFHAARRRLKELLDKYGLAGTDFVNQLHRELYAADFLTESAKLDLTEWMAEVDYRLVEGGGEHIQLDALTARFVTHLKNE
jgi:replication factor C small subunit